MKPLTGPAVAVAILMFMLLVSCTDRVPRREWETETTEEAGLDIVAVEQFVARVGGRGCIVRAGRLTRTWGPYTEPYDVASAAKPIYAHFLMEAIENGLLPGLDRAVVDHEPRLATLNPQLGFKDKGITWRHLVTQISCYGVAEVPGRAFRYNDFQTALLWDTLFTRVYGAEPDSVDRQVLLPMLMDILECQDYPTFEGDPTRPGRLSISARDFARFGLLYLRDGSWRRHQVLGAETIRLLTSSPLPVDVPQSAGVAAEMILDQRDLGGGDQATRHVGHYSMMWWVNEGQVGTDPLWPDLPPDTVAALGRGGEEALFLFPAAKMVVVWQEGMDGDALQSGEGPDHALLNDVLGVLVSTMAW